MALLFWLPLLIVVYAYVGYPVVLRLFCRKKPVVRAFGTPRVSVIIAAHNEERTLPHKLSALQSVDYPAHCLQVIIVSDGSTDRTPEILRAASNHVQSIILEQSVGKAVALNCGVAQATGEVLVFLDARQSLEPNAIPELVSCLADPTVGAVSGELLLESQDGTPSSDALGLYWKIEKLTRKLESATGSVVGVTGAIYAMRRELFTPIPAGTLLDDVLIPLQVARAGKRVVFHPGAIARDRVFPESSKEFNRKVRTLTGNYQLLRLAPWLLSSRNPLLFRLVSHKLLRLAVPFLLILMMLSSAVLEGPFYRAALIAQLLFYGSALTGLLAPAARNVRAVSVPYTFTMLNVAAAKAFYNFIGGRTRWA